MARRRAPAITAEERERLQREARELARARSVAAAAAKTLEARAWLASELVELREQMDARAVLVIATGPSSGVFSELPGLSDAALGDGAPAALPLAAAAHQMYLAASGMGHGKKDDSQVIRAYRRLMGAS